MWNAVQASAHQANVSQWQGQTPREMGGGCVCCYCHSYSLIHSAPIRCLDNCDLDAHCWWSDITHTETYFSLGRSAFLLLSYEEACCLASASPDGHQLPEVRELYICRCQFPIKRLLSKQLCLFGHKLLLWKFWIWNSKSLFLFFIFFFTSE